jgi:hypothetical protein
MLQLITKKGKLARGRSSTMEIALSKNQCIGKFAHPSIFYTVLNLKK